ncbi:MAG: heavy-metal-associated domain-containing protein [Acidobacteria bacterium]|nr:heavy-metal-associated domain-containing protein [Acidobacteriota bacterium]
MRLIVLITALAAPLSAEFLAVRLEVEQMDCASCVRSLEAGLKRIRGVEKVTVSTANGAEFTLTPGNRVTLDRLRDAIKGVGFTPRTAYVTVKGKAVTADGKWRFDVDGIAQTFNMSASRNDTIRALRSNNGKTVTVKGVSPLPPDPRTTANLDVQTLEGQ